MLVLQKRAGFAPTRHPSCSLPVGLVPVHLDRNHLTPCEHVLCQTAQTPTFNQWDPAARHLMGCVSAHIM